MRGRVTAVLIVTAALILLALISIEPVGSTTEIEPIKTDCEVLNCYLSEYHERDEEIIEAADAYIASLGGEPYDSDLSAHADRNRQQEMLARDAYRAALDRRQMPSRPICNDEFRNAH